MKCPSCQTENSDTAKFCGVCGQALVAKTTCSHCKHENPQGFKFCEECGQPLTPPPATAAPSPSSPLPTSLANGRYAVKKFPREGGKKNVYFTHDTMLDLDMTFAF